MRRMFAAMLLLLPWAPVAEAQQTIVRGMSVAPDAYIRVWNLSGSVSVVGWDHDSLAVTGTADAGLGRLMMGGNRSSGKLGFDGPGEGEARLEIRVPRRSTVWVKTASASVEVSGVTGALDLYSVSGGIRVDGKLRQVNAESMGGDIQLYASAPSIRAKSGSGSVRLVGEGDDVTLSTVDGNLMVSSPSLRQTRLETISGAVRVEGGVERGGSLFVQTHSGLVELRLPRTAPLDFNLTTFAGTVKSDFPLPRRLSQAALRGHEVSFSNGPGGAGVTVRTYSGGILLRHRG